MPVKVAFLGCCASVERPPPDIRFRRLTSRLASPKCVTMTLPIRRDAKPGPGRRPVSADVFGAIADPTRRRLLEVLHAKDAPVHELAANFPASRPAISRHLRVLQDAGLVSQRLVGRERFYRVEARRLQPLADWLRIYDLFWDDRLASLGTLLRTEAG